VANHQVDELARRYSEAWNAHDLETIISMHAEDSSPDHWALEYGSLGSLVGPRHDARASM
jgi:hypothetical protein